MTYEGFRLKVSKYWRKGLAKERQKKLLGKDFTIISNNCWGGMIYESYNLPKNSPNSRFVFLCRGLHTFSKGLEGIRNSSSQIYYTRRFKVEDEAGIGK